MHHMQANFLDDSSTSFDIFPHQEHLLSKDSSLNSQDKQKIGKAMPCLMPASVQKHASRL